MAHGSKDAEPNLVPLLDLVLQLVMFFMVVTNFVMEQVNEQIKLPMATASKPLDKSSERTVYLNVDKEGQVQLSPLDRIGNESVLTNAKQVETYMKRRYEQDQQSMKPEERGKGPKLRVVIRADELTDTEKVDAVMKACRLAGFSSAELRVLRA
jgi:biopolymer transport protein ExbD